MKNLTKIFMTVVAGMFAFSCVTDTTNDINPELGLGDVKGETTLTFSLEGSRTQLGEKVGDLYKLFWSEGDKIAVNGQPSITISIEEDNPAAATFTFDEPGVTRPYCVVYPAPEAMAITEGEANDGGTGESEPATPTTVCPVTFLATQSWVDGTFCEGAAPMYGYGEAAAEDEATEPIQLQHLAGVLRIAPKGNVTLTSLTVKSEKGAIAGPFMVDCTTGALTAQEGASAIVTVDFGAGLTLNAETATPIYVAVPAGSYGTFLVTLHTATDKMTVKFNSDVKPIAVGKVREFTEFDYVPNTLDTDNGEFLIESKEDLIEFARIASTFYPRATAKVTATEPIDMTGYDWKPIEGFGPYTFDGGEVEIKGLNAPLFAETYATIKNVRLTDVALEGDDVKKYGAIAYSIANGALINCSATGTMTYNLVTPSLARVGGLVGMLDHCEFTNCTNNVNITVNGTIENSEDSLLHLGGMAGWMQNPQCKIEETTNYGTITVTGKVDRTNIGGFLGYCDAAAEIDKCYNRGEMVLAAEVLGNAFSIFTGFIGSLDAGFDTENPTCKITNCENHGDVTFGTKGGDEGVAPTAGKSVYYTHIGGFLGYTRDIEDNYFALEMTSCKNYGNVSMNMLEATNYVKASGLISQLAADLTMDSCSNHGEIGVYKGANNGCHIGSLIAHIATPSASSEAFTTISNTTNEGAVYTGAIEHDYIYYSGGLIGYVQYTNLTMTGVHNNGTVEFNHTSKTENLYQGGFIGYINSSTRSLSLDDCSNTKSVTFNTKTTSGGNAYIGGIIGYNGSKENKKFNKVKNSGAISFTGVAGRIPFGGLIGATANGVTLTNCSNEGNLTYEDKDETRNANYFWLGGLVGVCYSASATGADIAATQTITATTCSNSGTLTIKNSTFNTDMILGGIVAGSIWRDGNKYMSNYIFTDCTNSGDLVAKEAMAGSHNHVGGILGSGYSNTALQVTIKKPVVSGDITFTHATGGKPLYIGGVVAGLQGTANIGKNDSGVAGSVSGSITVDVNAAGNLSIIGGVVGSSVTTATIADVNVLSVDDNKIDVKFNSSGVNTYVGGLVGYIGTAVTFNNLTNARPVNATITSMTANAPYIGGVFARNSVAVTATNCSNSGAVTLNVGTCSTAAYVGGITGFIEASSTLTNCSNSGAVTFNPTTITSTLNIGGLIGYTNAINTVNSCYNEGSINLNRGSYKAIYLGGAVGYANYSDSNKAGGFTNCYNRGTITLSEGVESTGNIRMAGFTGYHKIAYDKNIANYGDINVGATSTAQILLGGVYGYSGSAYVMDGGYTNTGNITITGGTGTATNFATAVGGIVGVFYNGVENAVNTGNITMSGDGNKDYCTFGGIVGFSYGRGTVQNCKSYCNIKADDYKYVGWIVAGTRVENVNTSNVNRTAHVRNCQLGGVKMEWDNETEEEKVVSVFDDDNFMKYIYSDRDNTEVDGCTYSKTKPTITYLYETNNAQ